MEAEYSEQEQKIIKYVIKNAPYGELQDVLKELGKILDNFDVNSEFIQTLIREHNEEHLALITDSDTDNKFLAAPIFYQDGVYIDQKGSQKLQVDHLNLKVVSKETVELNLNPTFEEYRKLIEAELERYISQYYKPGNCQYSTFIDFDEEEFTFYICLTSKNLNLKNFHGGEWVSEWKIDSTGLQGKIRINTHYFEDGNVALKDVKNIKNEFTFTGQKEEEAKKLVSIIQQEESNIQNGLDNIYSNMNTQFFKNMRRVLPVTNQKVEWSLYSQKMRGNLNSC